MPSNDPSDESSSATEPTRVPKSAVAIVVGAALVGGLLVWNRTHDTASGLVDASMSATTARIPQDAMTADAGTSSDASADWTQPEAYYEAAIVTSIPEGELKAYLAPKALAALLTPAHCGDATTCDAVRDFVLHADHSKSEIMTAERWTLPPADRIKTAAPDLTLAELTLVQTLHRVFVLRLGGPSKGHLVARAGFALSAALATKVHGFVYDEVRQRIETPALALQKCITSPLGVAVDPALRIALQALPHASATPDAKHATFRLTSHGMKRFGAPDLEIVCAEDDLGTAGTLLNALAATIVTEPTPKRSIVTRVQNEDLAVELSRAPLAEAQPINTVLRATLPEGALGGTRDPLRVGAWTDAATDDDRRAAKAAIDRAMKNGTVKGLLVRADFSSDAGVEAMWVELTGREGEVCTGLLRSHPTMATHLRYGESLTIPLASIDQVQGAPSE